MTKLQKEHMMILLESIEGKVLLSLEAFGTLNDKIDGVEERLGARIDQVDSILKMTVAEVSSLNRRASSLENKVDSVEKNLTERIDAVYSELIAHRNDTEQHRLPVKKNLKRVA